MSKTVRFQTVQFNISTQLNSILAIDRTLPGAATPGQSKPGSDGNKGVLRIPQSSSITEISPSDCLVLYPEHSLRGGGLTPLQRSSRYILQPQPTGQFAFINFLCFIYLCLFVTHFLFLPLLLTEMTIQTIPHTNQFAPRRTTMPDIPTPIITPEPFRIQRHPRQHHRIRIIMVTPVMVVLPVRLPLVLEGTAAPETLEETVTCQITTTMEGRSMAVSSSGSTSITQMRPDITTSATTTGNSIRHITSLPAVTCRRGSKSLFRFSRRDLRPLIVNFYFKKEERKEEKKKSPKKGKCKGKKEFEEKWFHAFLEIVKTVSVKIWITNSVFFFFLFLTGTRYTILQYTLKSLNYEIFYDQVTWQRNFQITKRMKNIIFRSHNEENLDYTNLTNL